MANQTDFEVLIQGIFPKSFPILRPFKYYLGSVIQEIFVTDTTFNNTSSLQLIEQQIDANKNTTAFANYKITSVKIVTEVSNSDRGLSGGKIAGLVIGVLVLPVLLFVYCYVRVQKTQSEETENINTKYMSYSHGVTVSSSI